MPVPDPALPDPAWSDPARSDPLSPDPLLSAVRQWRERSVAWLRVDDPDTAGRLAGRKPPLEAPRVVVLGETNSGKSSLVNALLGTPGLSPVDAGTATCTYLVFTHAPVLSTVARFGGGMADVAFPPGALRAWATIDGEPDVDIPSPRWIEVGVNSELTTWMTLVDTPGVGGLVAAHAELAAEAAAAAAALLFVVDASAPFTRGELDFVRAVADRVETVHFVMTKTDAFRGWREIIEADRTLLARYAPRFAQAPFHPVSSRLADAAAAASDPRIGQALTARSGFAGLRSILRSDVASVAATISEANIVRTSITVLAGTLARLDGSRQALTSGADQAEVLEARRGQLVAQRKAGTRGWQVMLRAEIQRARVELTHETAREVREAGQMFRGSIDQADNAELKQMAFHIDAYVQAMTARAHGRLTEAMGRICHTVLRELFTPPELTVLVAQLATRPYSTLATRGHEKPRNLDDTILTMTGAGMGFSLSRLVTMLPAAALPAAFGVVLMPVSIVMGGAAAMYLVRSRRRMATKAHLKQWLMEVLGEVKAQIERNIAEQFIEADEQLTLALDDALTRQVAALDEMIREVDGALRLDASERAMQVRALDERRSTGTGLVTGGEQLLQDLHATRLHAPADYEMPASHAGPALPTTPPADLIKGAPPGAPVIKPGGGSTRSIRVPVGLANLVAEQRRAAAAASASAAPMAWPGAPEPPEPPLAEATGSTDRRDLSALKAATRWLVKDGESPADTPERS